MGNGRACSDLADQLNDYSDINVVISPICLRFAESIIHIEAVRGLDCEGRAAHGYGILTEYTL